MELNCDPCDTVHKVTPGQAEKIIYALLFERADDQYYGVDKATETPRGSDDYVMCVEEALKLAEWQSERGKEVDLAVLRRQDRVDRKRRQAAKEASKEGCTEERGQR